MNTKNKSAARWRLFLGYLGIMTMILACVGTGAGAGPGTSTPNSDEVLIHLEDGVVKVQDDNGDWTPVAGDSAFDVTAPLESMDPWKVAGMTLETNESTQIEEGLQVGNWYACGAPSLRMGRGWQIPLDAPKSKSTQSSF